MSKIIEVKLLKGSHMFGEVLSQMTRSKELKYCIEATHKSRIAPTKEIEYHAAYHAACCQITSWYNNNIDDDYISEAVLKREYYEKLNASERAVFIGLYDAIIEGCLEVE